MTPPPPPTRLCPPAGVAQRWCPPGGGSLAGGSLCAQLTDRPSPLGHLPLSLGLLLMPTPDRGGALLYCAVLYKVPESHTGVDNPTRKKQRLLEVQVVHWNATQVKSFRLMIKPCVFNQHPFRLAPKKKKKWIDLLVGEVV